MTEFIGLFFIKQYDVGIKKAYPQLAVSIYQLLNGPKTQFPQSINRAKNLPKWLAIKRMFLKYLPQCLTR